jgi:hypothetical protein
MKKVLVMMAFTVGLLTVGSEMVTAQQKVCRGQTPTISAKGNYSNGQSTTVQRSYASSVLPLYTTLDTIAATATDSFKLALYGDYNSVTFQHDWLKVAGTPTVTVACYASSNGGVSYDPTAIAAYTVNPSSLTAPVSKITVINSGAGNPYTNYLWVTAGSASSTISAKGYVVPR